MTDTLFDLSDSPSPRLEWMRRHGVIMEKHIINPMYCARKETQCHPSGRFEHPKIGYGLTMDEALTDFAIKNNLKLWNEE